MRWWRRGLLDVLVFREREDVVRERERSRNGVERETLTGGERETGAGSTGDEEDGRERWLTLPEMRKMKR